MKNAWNESKVHVHVYTLVHVGHSYEVKLQVNMVMANQVSQDTVYKVMSLSLSPPPLLFLSFPLSLSLSLQILWLILVCKRYYTDPLSSMNNYREF